MPPSGTEYTTYTVKSGDTLYKLAQQYNIAADAIMRYNNLTSNLLNVGQVLKIPTQSGNVPPTTPPSEGVSYIVKPGDSLYKIAQQYDTSVDALMQYNNLNSTALQVGQVIKIPSSASTEEIRYVVKSGDSLYKIAQQYNTSVDAIKRGNGLGNDALSIGQVLIITR